MAGNPLLAGVRGHCPRCGEGRLFGGFLRLAERCDVCGQDLAKLNVADGPAFFAMSIVGIVIGFAALIVEVAYSPPVWLHLVLWLPLIVLVSLALLRPIKGLMVGMQFRHRAAEVRNEDF